MPLNENALHFFLGAHTPTGFVSQMHSLQNPEKINRIFCINGSPGSGKSTMINKIASEFSQYDVPYIFHCAFSPSSLDAVYFPSLGFAAADASYPHPIIPKCPGCFENMISLYECCDSEKLSLHRQSILELSELKRVSLGRCHRFLCAAGTINGDTYRTAAEYTDSEKIERFVYRFFHKFPKARLSCRGEEFNCFMSAFTKDGVVIYPESLSKLCSDVYIIEDDCGAVSKILMNKLRNTALENGYNIISCRCPTAPDKPEHNFIPQLSVTFTVSNRFHPIKETVCGKTINSRRFTDTDISTKKDRISFNKKAKKDRISFNKKAVFQIFTEAASSMSSAAKAHEETEKIYSSLTDFDKVNRITRDVIYKIKKTLVSR